MFEVRACIGTRIQVLKSAFTLHAAEVIASDYFREHQTETVYVARPGNSQALFLLSSLLSPARGRA